MHELSLAQNIIEIAVATADKNSASKINKINLKIGKLSAVDVNSLMFALDAVKETTIADTAEILLEQTDIIGKCNECGTESLYEDLHFQCRVCNSYDVKLISGEEMEIVDIEVD